MTIAGQNTSCYIFAKRRDTIERIINYAKFVTGYQCQGSSKGCLIGKQIKRHNAGYVIDAKITNCRIGGFQPNYEQRENFGTARYIGYRGDILRYALLLGAVIREDKSKDMSVADGWEKDYERDTARLRGKDPLDVATDDVTDPNIEAQKRLIMDWREAYSFRVEAKDKNLITAVKTHSVMMANQGERPYSLEHTKIKFDGIHDGWYNIDMQANNAFSGLTDNTYDVGKHIETLTEFAISKGARVRASFVGSFDMRHPLLLTPQGIIEVERIT